jgi:hypothetical protein
MENLSTIVIEPFQDAGEIQLETWKNMGFL